MKLPLLLVNFVQPAKDILVFDISGDDQPIEFLESNPNLLHEIEIYDRAHPDGYLVYIISDNSAHVESISDLKSRTEVKSFIENFSLMSKNAKGVIVREKRASCEHTGLILTHFGGFLRSTNLPAIILNDDHLSEALDEIIESEKTLIRAGLFACELGSPWIFVANQNLSAASHGFLAVAE